MMTLLKRLIPETSPLRLKFHHAKAIVAAVLCGFPAKRLTVISVTGTDGKTTTVGMIAHILNESGIKTGALSTAFFQIGGEIRWNPTQKTSPSPFLVQRFLKEIVDAGCTHAVIECSSHGLLQGRLNHTYPIVAGITNISEEHLDYHGTMENYVAAKALLFKMLSPSNRERRGTKVLHHSDRSYRTLQQIRSKEEISYNAEGVDIDGRYGPPMNLWLEDTEITSTGSAATLVWYARSSTGSVNYPLTLKIPGLFNLENALCAIGCVKGLPDPPSMNLITKALSTFAGVPGRMERIEAGQDFSVYIDFTVTPKSYETTLSTLKSMLTPSKRLMILCGSCGDRMNEKRPIVGKIVSSHADVMVVANEDPYTEDPEKIIDEVWAGINQSHTLAHRIFDRLEAIRFLLNEAKTGDIVIFCGKGADITMMTNKGQIPWNEREIVRRELEKLRPH